MSNGFPYWQFHSERWLTGKINAFELDEQGLFLHFCMRAWASHGPFNICSTLVQREFNKSSTWVEQTVAAFLDCGLLVRDGDKYKIKFVDAQLAEMVELRDKRSRAGKNSAAVRASPHTPLEIPIQNNTSAKQSSALTSAEHPLNTCSTPVEARTGLQGMFDKIRAARPEHRNMREMDVVTLLAGCSDEKAVGRMVDEWCVEQANSPNPLNNPIASLRKRVRDLTLASDFGQRQETDPGILDYAKQYSALVKFKQGEGIGDLFRKARDNYGPTGADRLKAAAKQLAAEERKTKGA